jgi:adenylate cyclase
MNRLSVDELAELSGVDAERVSYLVDADVLSASHDGSFRPSDVQIVRIVEALERAGISVEQMSALIRAGEFSLRLTEIAFPQPPALSSKTLAEIAAELQVPLGVIDQVFAAAGLPRPSAHEPIREDDAQALRTIAMVYESLGRNAAIAVEPNRHLGENLRRVAESQLRFFKKYVQQPMIDSGLSFGEVLEGLSKHSESWIPASVDSVLWLYRRHFEQFIMQDIVELAEAALERTGMASPRPANPPAIAFLDLTSYTTLTEQVGDETAADIATRLTDVVRDASRAYGGHPVKFLGDGVMFFFADPAGAVLCGLDLVEQVPALGLPPARIGMTAGPVVFRDGDYFGRTVNVAARIADYARPEEVLVSEEIRSSTTPPGVSYTAVGSVSLKGVPRPTVLHRALRA